MVEKNGLGLLLSVKGKEQGEREREIGREGAAAVKEKWENMV